MPEAGNPSACWSCDGQPPGTAGATRGARPGWQALENLRQQQASALAYFDCFWLMAVVMLAPVPAVLLMRRSVAEKGARIGAE